jgi:hypothetical protein
MAEWVSMDLQLGITGIQGRKDPLPKPPFTDLNAFRSHCHLAARAVGANLGCIEDPYEANKQCNYAMARFEFSDTPLAVLLNVVHPIVAFAKWPGEGQLIFEYIDCPRLAEEFRIFGQYTVATSEDLNRPLLRDMCKDLSPIFIFAVGTVFAFIS